MNLVAARISLIALSLLGLGAGITGMRVSMGREDEPQSLRAPPRRRGSVPDIPDSIWMATADRAPFRAARRLADVAYDPDRLGTPVLPIQAPVRAPPKPALVVSGIIWGREPAALVEGWPGIEGPRVVRRGDVVGGLTVKHIWSSGIVVAGLDTTWNLTVRTPWQ